MQRIAIAFSLVCLSVLSSGCASVGKMPKMPWEPKEPETKIPIKMAVTWNDAVRYNPNDPATRGFGGRIHFYDETNKPVRVKGTLTIYGYDDSRPGGMDPERPDRKYVFEAENLESHYSMSKLGHSYSFWIPWDRAGGEQKDITLAPFFRPEVGQMVMSEQSKHILPGVNSKQNELENQPSPSDMLSPEVAQVAYERANIAAQAQKAANGQLKTTTIALPSSMKQRLHYVEPGANQRQTQQASPRQDYQGRGFQSQQNLPQQQTQPLMQQQAAQLDAGQYQSRAPQSLQLKPGVNLQTFRPQFSESRAYSNYLASGHPITHPQATALAAEPGSPLTSPQLQGQQIGQPISNHLQTPQSPTLWPPGLPQTR